jgi:pimeloyl-ACP methyl ester carboxylesterase
VEVSPVGAWGSSTTRTQGPTLLPALALGCAVLAVATAVWLYWLVIPGALFSAAAVALGVRLRRSSGRTVGATAISLGITALFLVPSMLYVTGEAEDWAAIARSTRRTLTADGRSFHASRRWVVLTGSGGSPDAFATAWKHPDRVSRLGLVSVRPRRRHFIRWTLCTPGFRVRDGRPPRLGR